MFSWTIFFTLDFCIIACDLYRNIIAVKFFLDVQIFFRNEVSTLVMYIGGLSVADSQSGGRVQAKQVLHHFNLKWG